MIETFSQWISVATGADAYSHVPKNRDWRARERRAAGKGTEPTRNRSFLSFLFRRRRDGGD